MLRDKLKKIAKALYLAAERIETGKEKFCCDAIGNYDARLFFQNIFEQDASALPYHNLVAWASCKNDNDNEELKARRVLLLCFAALMAEEGEGYTIYESGEVVL